MSATKGFEFALLKEMSRRALWIAPVRRAQLKISMRNAPACCFLWVPKAAGTSVFEWLATEIGMKKLRDQRDFRVFPNRGAVTFGHVHYLSLRSAGYVNDAYHAESVRFTVVRNPYERIVSLYGYLQRHRNYSDDFGTFLYKVECELPSIGLYNVAGLSQANRQLDWLLNAEGRLLPQKIFHQENLEEIEDVLPRLLNWSPLNRLPHKNVNKNVKSLDELLGGNAEHLAIINRVYRADFERLNYQMIPA